MATASRFGSVSPWNPPYAQWVVKLSKHCNLRCAYCYEYPFLADKSRMELRQIEAMFRHIAARFTGTSRRMDFVWHGGEPLLQKPAYYRTIGELEHEIFDPVGIGFHNFVQTNLTILNEGTLSLFRTFFQNVGVSIDLFGEQRVNIAGRPVEHVVIRNMQTLKDEGISFGCITVLSKATAPHVEAIYRFFEDIQTSFRFLPIYRTGYIGQQDTTSLTAEEIVMAFQKIVDLWLASDRAIRVNPVQEYIVHVVRRLDGGQGKRRYYDKRRGEIVYIVDTDGSLYSNADAYDPMLCHGNLFDNSLFELERSVGYDTAVQLATDRMTEVCGACRYHGACSGYFMGEATPEQRWRDHEGRLRCGVARPMQEYIERRLIEAGLVDTHRDLLLVDRLRHLLEDPEDLVIG